MDILDRIILELVYFIPSRFCKRWLKWFPPKRRFPRSRIPEANIIDKVRPLKHPPLPFPRNWTEPVGHYTRADVIEIEGLAFGALVTCFNKEKPTPGPTDVFRIYPGRRWRLTWDGEKLRITLDAVRDTF